MFILLFILGLCFGSFGSVVVHRIHEKKPGILTGRSACPSCSHILGWKDLFPVFSYLSTKGKCRYCQKKIPAQYPIMELVCGLSFAFFGSWMYQYIQPVDIYTWTYFGVCMLVVYTVFIFTIYDIAYMEVPDEFILPVISLVFFLLVISKYFPVMQYIEPRNISIFIEGLIASMTLYIFLGLQMILPAGYVAIRDKKYRLLLSLARQMVLFPVWVVFRSILGKKLDSWFPEDEEELPTGIGAGDFRIVFLTGLFGGIWIGWIGLFIAYLLGGTYGAYLMIRGESRTKRVPFGPFLGYGFLLAFCSHQFFSLYLFV